MGGLSVSATAPSLHLRRANALEEQLKEQELRACETALQEARRHRELMCKMERERSLEVESLQARWGARPPRLLSASGTPADVRGGTNPHEESCQTAQCHS